MKFRITLLTGIFTLLFGYSYGQSCAAYGSVSQTGASVTFNDTSWSVNGHTSDWSFGDGTYGSGTSVSHTYTSNGTYMATLFIYDSLASCGDSTSFTITITSVSNCNPTFTYNVDTPNSLKVHFYGSTPPTGGSASWNIYESGTLYQYSGRFINHTFASTGAYVVVYYLNDSIGVCDSIDNTIQVSSPPSCYGSFTYTVDNSNPYKLNFVNNSVGATGAYWWFGGSNTSTQYTPSFTFSTAGYHTVCLTTYDSLNNFCDSICSTVYVPGTSGSGSGNCDAAFTVATSGLTATFYDSLTTTSLFQWSFGDGSYGYSSNPSHTYASTGAYTTCLFIYDVDSLGDTTVCDSFCQTIQVSSPASCYGSFTYTVDNSNPYKLNFINNSVGATGAYWWFGGSNTSTQYNPSFTFSTAGYHTVCLTTYDSLNNFCDSICSSVYVPGTTGSGNCDAAFTTTTSGLTASFYDSLTATSLFQWNFGDGSYSSSSNPSHTYSSAGTYTACLFVYDIDSLGDTTVCDSFCTTVTVGSSSSCTASYYLAIDTTSIYNLYIVNNSTGTTATTNYYWTFGDGTGSSAQNPTHQYATFGLYQLCLTLQDSIAGCYSTYCDSIGLDSNGNLLKKDGFQLTIVDEEDLLNVREETVLNGVNVFPNPSTGIFRINLNLSKAQNLELQVLNSLGQVVLNETNPAKSGENDIRLDLADQENGLYFIQMKAGNHIKNTKVYIIK